MENLTQDSWLKVYENLSKSEDITPRQLKSIKDVWVLKEVEDFLILGCFSEETRVLLEKNLRSEILKALSFVFPKVTDFSVSILSSSVVSSQEKIKSLDLLFADNKTSSFLNEKFTFENFIIGESNKMAHAASVYVSEKPGSPLYSVLYISGSPGLGKTHLLNAIGNNIVSVFPEKKVLYINAADYTEEYIYSLNTKSIDSFNNKYKGLDVILIDDIQFFANKEKTSEAFFTFLIILL